VSGSIRSCARSEACGDVSSTIDPRGMRKWREGERRNGEKERDKGDGKKDGGLKKKEN
jgi:hypothetical protein